MKKLIILPVIFLLATNLFAQSANDFIIEENATGVTIIGYRGTTKQVVIPQTIGGRKVTEIGDGAFYDNQLTSVTIPDSVTTIRRSAFYQNNLTSIVIPQSVREIYQYAFLYNPLTSVTIGANVRLFASSDGGVFSEFYNLDRVYDDQDRMAGTFIFSNGAWTKQVISERELRDLITNYINVLLQNNIMGQTQSGQSISPREIIAARNANYLQAGIVITIPVREEARELITHLTTRNRWIFLGTLSWGVSYNQELQIIRFEDSGM